MPRFFFDVFDGSDIYVDDVGEELSDAQAAWSQATRSAGRSITALDGKLKPGGEWHMDVVDASGARLYRLHMKTSVTQ